MVGKEADLTVLYSHHDLHKKGKKINFLEGIKNAERAIWENIQRDKVRHTLGMKEDKQDMGTTFKKVFTHLLASIDSFVLAVKRY